MSKNIFDEYFNPYREERSKFKGCFTIFIYNLSQEITLEKISHQIGLINLISDKMKKNYLLSRVYEFKDHITNKYTDSNISGIYLVGDTVNLINILPQWKKNIEQFDINNFIFKYDEFYDITYLEDLCLNTNYVNVLTVSQSKFTHFYYTISKRKNVGNGSSTTVELQNYLKSLGKNIVLLHGNGQILKNFPEDKNIIVIPKILNEEEIMEEFDKKDNIAKSEELSDWLGKILHPEYGKRLRFGKDIREGIVNRQIQKIYCIPEIAIKLKNRFSEDMDSVQMIVIRSYGNDIGKTLKDSYNGALGISYY
jgi:hypothetical protein